MTCDVRQVLELRRGAGVGGIRSARHGHNTYAGVDTLPDPTAKLLRSGR